jgi:hypothetical protein
MVDTASLQIKVTATGVETATGKLKGLGSASKDAQKATDGLMGSFKRMLGPLLASVSAFAALNKLVDVTREFNKLNAALITSTGSAEGAATAFDALQQFAATTPYDLQQTVTAFNKLVNYGLTPSEAALKSYGNTAAAMGRDLGDLVQAVANATTGEFEMLKGFGIKAKIEGDNVNFIFRGMSTTVGNSAAEIEKYMLKLGENEFAGAMAERAKTLDGAISNLEDSWNQMFLSISTGGGESIMRDIVLDATKAIEDMTAMIASGQLDGYLKGIFGSFAGYGSDVANLQKEITLLLESTQIGSRDAGSAISDTFTQMPQNIRAFVQVLTVEILALVDKTEAYGKEIAENLRFWKKETFDLEAALAGINDAREQGIQSIMDERVRAIDSAEAQIKKADELRAAYDAAKAAKAKLTGNDDALAQFKIGGEVVEGPTTQEREATAKALAAFDKELAAIDAQAQAKAEQQKQTFDALIESLRTEEEAIQDSYNRRREIILMNTEEGPQQDALLGKLDTQTSDQVTGGMGGTSTIDEQLAALDEEYARKREIKLGNEEMTNAMLLELARNHEEQKTAMLSQYYSMQLGNAAAGFGAMAQLAKTFGGEQSKAYKVLFATSQAFSLAKAVMNMHAGISAGVALGFPMSIPAVAMAAAQGASAIAGIKGQSFSGAYDAGGNIPAGSFGLVGEVGPELVSGPANVTSRKDTAEMLGSKSTVKVAVFNLMDNAALLESLKGSDDFDEVVINSLTRNQTAAKSAMGQNQ